MNNFVNKLYCMDNLELLKQLPNESIDLIYCDILYNTGKKFKDYDDNLGTPQEAIEWYKPRLIEMKRVLKGTGSIYLHCDYHLNSYLRVEMDKIFGVNNFRNELIRINCNPKNNSNNFGRIYDNILYYVKSKNFIFNVPTEPKNEGDIIKQFNKIDENGNRYTTTPLHAKGKTKNGESGMPWNSSKGLIYPPENRHWRMSHENLNILDKKGLIEWSINNNPRKIIYAKDYLDKNVQNILIDYKSMGYENEYVIYDTQKPKSLLDMIIRSSSNEGDIIADFFCGSGTSLVVAKELGRNYIGCDINIRAIEITEKRLQNLVDKR